MEYKSTERIGFMLFYVITFMLYNLNNFVDRFCLFYFDSLAYVYKAFIYLLWLLVAIFSFNKKTSIYMNVFICILLIYSFFDIGIGFTAFITYYLPAIATFFFFSNIINSIKEINFIILLLGCFFILSVFYVVFNEIFGYAAFEKEAFYLLGNLFESDGVIRIRSFFVGEQTLYIYGISIVILSFVFNNKYRYIFLFTCAALSCFYMPKNPLAFICIFVFILFILKIKFNPIFFHIYFLIIICIIYYFAKITYFSDIWSLHGSLIGYTPFGTPSVITRYEIWDNVVSFIFTNPFGYGLGSASYVFGGVKIIAPHSEYLKELLELGIIGFCVFYMFLYRGIKLAWILYIKSNANIFLCFISYIFAFIFINFFNDHFFGNAEKLFFWMIAGLIYNFNDKALNKKFDTRVE